LVATVGRLLFFCPKSNLILLYKKEKVIQNYYYKGYHNHKVYVRITYPQI
jgi:hypothetical protein